MPNLPRTWGNVGTDKLHVLPFTLDVGFRGFSFAGSGCFSVGAADACLEGCSLSIVYKYQRLGIKITV